MRVGLSLGHGAKWSDGKLVKDPGAIHPEIKITEYETCSRIFKVLFVLLKEYKPIDVCSAPCGVPMRERIDYLNLDHKHRKKMDLAIELHANGFNKRDVDGTECLYWPDSDYGLEAATELVDSISAYVQKKNRGVKARDDLGFLRQTAMPAVIVEPFFITSDNSANAVLTDDLIHRAAFGIFQGLLKLEKQE